MPAMLRAHPEWGRRGALVGGTVGLAGLSLLLPSVPTTDPWGWIVWGREVAAGELHTAVGGSPAWKPLPVLFTAPLSVFGDAAPALWLVTARAAGLAALLLAFRLGSRLGGRAAGAVAALVLLLSDDYVRALAHGYSEPMLVALLLGAVDRHLEGRRGQALVLLFLAALGRPEAWAFLVVYGVIAARAEPTLWLPAGGLAAAVPALWLGGDWWGSGDPLHGGKAARAVTHHGLSAFDLSALGRLVVPVLVLAAVAFVAAWRRGDRTVPWLAALACAWVACVVGQALAGSPVSPRFLAPVVAVGCVLAGVGAAEAVRAAPRARAAVLLVLVLAAVPFLVERVPGVDVELHRAAAHAQDQQRVTRTVAGLSARAPACGAFVLPAPYGWNEGAVAWELGLPLARTGVLPVRHVSPHRLRAALDFSHSRGPVYFVSRTLGPVVTVIDPFPRRPTSVGEQRLSVRPLEEGSGWHAYRVSRPGARHCRRA